MKSLQPGDSITVILLVVVRQVGNKEKCFFRLSQPEGFKFELFCVETQAQRLVGVGPRWTQGGHHLNSAIHKLFEIEIKAPVGFSQVGRP